MYVPYKCQSVKDFFNFRKVKTSTLLIPLFRMAKYSIIKRVFHFDTFTICKAHVGYLKFAVMCTQELLTSSHVVYIQAYKIIHFHQ